MRLFDLQEQLRQENEEYLKEHPELKGLLSLYMARSESRKEYNPYSLCCYRGQTHGPAQLSDSKHSSDPMLKGCNDPEG